MFQCRTCLSKHEAEDIAGHYSRRATKKRDAEEIEKADCAELVRSGEFFRMDQNLKDRASSAEGLDVGAPGETGKEQTRDKQKIPAEQQDEPKN